jgi:hypothetical protein
MIFFEYLFNVFAYESLILGCSAPVLVILSLLHLPKGSVVVAGLVWLFGGLWIARNAARRRVFGGEGFFEAIRSAFAEGRLIMSFFPVVGKLFRVRSRERSPFERPDDPRPL